MDWRGIQQLVWATRILIVAVAATVTSGAFANDPVPGEVFELDWEGREDPVLVFVPENYDPAEKWPVIAYYPGTNGSPSVSFYRRYTGDRDFIIVGMSYAVGEGGVLKYIEERIREEGLECQKIVRHLGERLSIDSTRVYVSGFSKGGWFSAMVIDRERAFAGALILGAGVFDHQRFTPPRFAKPLPVYVGVGQTDWNYVMSLSAKVHFQKLGARVSFDEWAGLGHALPVGAGRSEHLEQWLWLEAHRGEQKAIAERALTWFEGAMERLEAEADSLARYLALERVQQAPLLAHAEGAWEDIDARLKRLRTEDDAVAAEWEIEQEYRAILRKEMENRYMSTITWCAEHYLALGAAHPGSHFGALALKHHERTSEMIADGKAREKAREKARQ